MNQTPKRAPVERIVGGLVTLREIDRCAQQTYPLHWQPVPATLPPPAYDGSHWSERVWLALADGSVRIGCCFYRPPNATYDSPVHAWSVEGAIGDSPDVIAWMPFAVPSHPHTITAG